MSRDGILRPAREKIELPEYNIWMGGSAAPPSEDGFSGTRFFLCLAFLRGLL